MRSQQTLNQLWCRALVSEFVRGGVRHAVICPGSRSTPLALACAENPEVRCWSVVDERSAGFFALGMAKQCGMPPLLIATSGTAGAHFYPAAIEAALTHLPMLVLTADRPWELQGFGAAQTIPQQALFGSFARLFLDLGEPEALDSSLRHLRASVHRALHAALHAPGGPVHLNAPFREPLVPRSSGPWAPALSTLAEEGRGESPFTAQIPALASPHPLALAPLRSRLERARSGLIVVGPRDAADGLGPALRKLSGALHFPLLAEASSQVRFGPGAEGQVISHYDVLLRSEAFSAAHRPEMILRFGGGITCKGLQSFIDSSCAAGAELAVFSDRGALHDPAHSATWILHGDPVAAAEGLLPEAKPDSVREAFAQDFLHAERRVRTLLGQLQADPLTEPTVAQALVKSLPPEAQLFLASSMPIRDVDTFASASDQPLRVLSNRGANGIDGTLSTGLGMAAASGKPVVVLTGDLAFLHDLGALLTAQRAQVSLCAVVVNNGGGGIFSFLPVAEASPQFETLFATSHQIRLEGLGKPFGFRYAAPQTAGELAEEVRRSLEGGLHLIEVQVPARADNVQLHRELFSKLVSAVEQRE